MGRLQWNLFLCCMPRFHSLAALILTQVSLKQPSKVIGDYMTALNSVSNELLAVLKVAQVRED